jgi:hypothetical protein
LAVLIRLKVAITLHTRLPMFAYQMISLAYITCFLKFYNPSELLMRRDCCYFAIVLVFVTFCKTDRAWLK